MWIRKLVVVLPQRHGIRQMYPKSISSAPEKPFGKSIGTCCPLSDSVIVKPSLVHSSYLSGIRREMRSMSSSSLSLSSSSSSSSSTPVVVEGVEDTVKDNDVIQRRNKSAVLREIYGVSNTTIRDSSSTTTSSSTGHGMGTMTTTTAAAACTSSTGTTADTAGNSTTATATTTSTSNTINEPTKPYPSSSSSTSARRLRINMNRHDNNHLGHNPTAATSSNTLHLDSTLYRRNTSHTRNKIAVAHYMQQQQRQQQQQGRIATSSPSVSSNSSSSSSSSSTLGYTRRQQLQHQRGTGGRETDTITIAARVPVTSIYVARHLDVVAILSNVFGKMNVTQHRFGRTSVTVQFPPRTNNDNDTTSTIAKERQPKDLETTATTTSNATTTTTIHDNHNNNKTIEDTLLPRYVVVFRFGSCVFFNFTNREIRLLLEDIKKRADCCRDPLPNGFEQREQFDIAISPGLDETSPFVTGDVATIKMLDLNNVAVISTVMGQTVALDSYNIYADELLATFATINTNVKRTGNFTSMERNALFKVIAQNNSLFIDMVSKLGLKDRSDTVAWNYTQYDAVYQGMRDEFLIDERFDDIEFKLNLIQQNTKFFLEVMHQNKTNLLEWIIIGLIALECGLMCLEMSGMGHLLFESLGITTAATTGSTTTAVSDTTSAATTLATSTTNPLLDSK